MSFLFWTNTEIFTQLKKMIIEKRKHLKRPLTYTYSNFINMLKTIKYVEQAYQCTPMVFKLMNNYTYLCSNYSVLNCYLKTFTEEIYCNKAYYTTFMVHVTYLLSSERACSRLSRILWQHISNLLNLAWWMRLLINMIRLLFLCYAYLY